MSKMLKKSETHTDQTFHKIPHGAMMSGNMASQRTCACHIAKKISNQKSVTY